MAPKHRETNVIAAQHDEVDAAIALELPLGPVERDFEGDVEYDALPENCDRPTVRDGDEIWRIDSTDAHCDGNEPPSTDGLSYYQLSGPPSERLSQRRNWQLATLQEFSAAGHRTAATVLVVHGNRTSLAEANEMVWDVYRHVSQASKQSLRMIVWTWPSQRTVRRPRRDVRLKAERTEWTGQQIAGVLKQIDPQSPVGLVGFSFGARAITKALHVLGREDSHDAPVGLRIVSQPGRPAPMRAMLIAAAMDNDALQSDGPHHLAISQVDRMIVTHNGCDLLLRTYRHLYCWHGPSALGVTGLPSDGSFNDSGFTNVESLDVSASVGRIHRWANYIRAPEITSALRHRLLGQSEPHQAAPVANDAL
jgi:hypothetical protein